MFKWIRRDHGCNCTPMGEGCEKYILHIGNLYLGIVESERCYCEEEDGERKFSWKAEIHVGGKMVTGQGGGGYSKDYYMNYVEERITEWLEELRQTPGDGHREVYDSLCQRDPVTGEFFQERLE